jgi:transcriptional regulator with XRE-family HTH domain
MHSAPWQPVDTFGARLRAERARLGYGLKTLAQATGAFGGEPLEAPVVARWHNCTHGPRADVLGLLARLSFDLPFLLTGVPDHAHHLAPDDGLGERRVPLVALYGPDGTPRWPSPITWTAPDAIAVARLHQRTSGGRRLAVEDLAAPFAALIVARAWSTWHPSHEGTHRRVTALAHAWLTTFALDACTGVQSTPTALADVAVRALRTQYETTRRAA